MQCIQTLSADYRKSKTIGDVEYFNYLDGMTTRDSRCTSGIKSNFAITKITLKENKKLFTIKFDLNFRN
jgi:hypothetical protein